jgi:hypothetical protein
VGRALDVGRFDDELASLGHGVAGVDGQVEQHLLQLAGVGLDGAQGRAQFDVLAEDTAEQVLGVGDATGR